MTSISISANSQIRQALNTGLIVHSGPFSFSIKSNIPVVIENIIRLYSGTLDIDRSCSTSFADFHISLAAPSILRRLLFKQVQFYLDGKIVFNPFPLHHATAMLEWGMNWCISTQIHTYLIIHAAVVEKNGFAAIMPAPPGSGKSTLCACLVQEGWRLLSDELTLINLDSFKAIPIPRPIGLKNQSIELIKRRYPDVVLGTVSSDTLKGSVCHLKPPKTSINKQYIESPIGWILFPKYERGADTELTEKSKGQAFMSIADNAFNYSTLGSTGFEALRNVVSHAYCFSFRYSNLDEAIEVFNQLEPPYEI